MRNALKTFISVCLLLASIIIPLNCNAQALPPDYKCIEELQLIETKIKRELVEIQKYMEINSDLIINNDQVSSEFAFSFFAVSGMYESLVKVKLMLGDVVELYSVYHSDDCISGNEYFYNHLTRKYLLLTASIQSCKKFDDSLAKAGSKEAASMSLKVYDLLDELENVLKNGLCGVTFSVQS